MNINIFEDLLIKAIKKQNINRYLRCTHYDPVYKILRNEEISIRHIFAICLYTDCSKLCTLFRQTYRKMETNEREHDISNRHRNLYWLGRFLFEAIEFYGSQMEFNMAVYHGLDKEMMFERFTAHFNQPISTTTRFATAQGFANGSGIILEFTRPTNQLIPKYIDAQDFSAFPNEDERLFYGKHILFQI
eukprot:38251_1